MRGALAWLRQRGFNATEAVATRGKFGGVQLKAGNIGYRIEFDARSGAHINVFAGKEKGPHFMISNMNRAALNAILRVLFD